MSVIPFPNSPAQPVKQDPNYRMKDESLADFHARMEAREPGWVARVQADCERSRIAMAERAEAKRLRRARPVDTLSGADLWSEYGEFQGEFEDQGRTTDPDRYRAIDAEIMRRLTKGDA